MPVLRSEHCRNPEAHDEHNGVERDGMGRPSQVHCDGTVEFLARELQREASPPPGPASPPRRRIDWTPVCNYPVRETCTAVHHRNFACQCPGSCCTPLCTWQPTGKGR